MSSRPKGVFISYRRDGGAETARVIEGFLDAQGCDVFLDVDRLGGGRFDAQILRHIEKRDVFILVCSRGCFDRCVNPDDWIRRELEHALLFGRRVVPVCLSGFEWPDPRQLPDSIREVARHNAFDYSHAHWKETRSKLMRLVDEADASESRAAAGGDGGVAPVAPGRHAGAMVEESDLSESLFELLDRLDRSGEMPAAEDAPLFAKAAERGDPRAQFQLGRCYANGIGVERIASGAVRWYQLAAGKGHAAARFNLAVSLRDGVGVTKRDPEAAVALFRLGAASGHVESLTQLGRCLKSGTGVKRDDSEAVRCFRNAADTGNALARNYLGECYRDGIGVQADPADAVRLFRIAAEAGCPEAQYNLGLCFKKGIGVERDEAESARWARRAAESGLEISARPVSARSPTHTGFAAARVLHGCLLMVVAAGVIVLVSMLLSLL